MNKSIAIWLALLTLAVLPPSVAVASQTNSGLRADRCHALTAHDFSAIPDAPTTVTPQTTYRELHGATVCEVVGTVGPDLGPDAKRGEHRPDVGIVRFKLLLPVTGWNNEFIEVGCGGECRNYSKWSDRWCPNQRGYACIISDMGVGRDDDYGPNALENTEFLDNWRLRINFTYRAAHVAVLAGKEIVKYYYGTGASESLMMGCSTGGYQAMVEAQRFPKDFDGIVAIAPDMDEADLAIRKAWFFKYWKKLDSADDWKRKLLHEAALGACPVDDGAGAKFLANPVACTFNPSVIACEAGQNSGPASRCLNTDDVEAAKNIYGAPKASTGEPISTGLLFPGSELSLGDYPQDYEHNWATAFFRYMFTVAGNSKWDIDRDFDADRDSGRLGLSWFYPDTNPDLRKFKAAGRKLIIAQGGSDAAEFPAAVIDYYETVERTMGGRAATQEFVRLFIVPGMHHCTGGEGPFAIDYLKYLEAWVKPQGAAPDKLVGAHVPHLSWGEAMSLRFPIDPSTVSFTRPIYPFPAWARYKGVGDASKAENYEAVSP